LSNDPKYLPPQLAQPLASRLNTLPLILAGPILRRVDAHSVTVWIALRTSHSVALKVLPNNSTTPVLTSSFVPTMKVGEHLYVVAVTASSASVTLSNQLLYTYQLQFQPTGSSDTFSLHTPGYFLPGTPTPGGQISLADAGEFSYSDIGDPCFCLPPNDPQDLRVIHGSCRKAHADSVDALATVDDYLLGVNGEDPGVAPAVTVATRPHQLILTGDQIYADDVADVLLAMLTDAAQTLIGVPEQIPLLGASDGLGEATRFGPASRQAKLTKQAGFTSTAARSHLISFGEFMAMYLFAYSGVLWPPPVPPAGPPTTLPAFEELFFEPGTGQPKPAPRNISEGLTAGPNPYFTQSEEQRDAVMSFARSLGKVRRALANMPTYMIFDDHEITDDWFMNRRFCQKVVPNDPGSPNGLGMRIILNGLTAYALCQGWGNTSTPGVDGDVSSVLSKFATWQAASFPPSGNSLSGLRDVLGLPTGPLQDAPNDTTVTLLPIASNAVRWNYSGSWASHELIVVDSRTRRGYTADALADAALIAESAIHGQVGLPFDPALEDKVSFVVVPGPIDGAEPVLETLQSKALSFEGMTFSLDVETWKGDRTAFERLLSELAIRGQRNRRYVVLSGDVHHGFARRFQYWAPQPPTDPTGGMAAATFAMMTSSALKNESLEPPWESTRVLHHLGFTTVNPLIKRTTTRLTFNLEQSDPKNSTIVVGKSATNQDVTAVSDRSIAGIDNLDVTTAGLVTAGQPLMFSKQPNAIAISTLLRDQNQRTVSSHKIPSKPMLLTDRLNVLVDGVKQSLDVYFNSLTPGIEVVGVNNVGFVHFKHQTVNGVDHFFAIQELRWWPGEARDAYLKQIATPYFPPSSVTVLACDLTIEAKPTFPSV
jgi:hypothetical protein